METDGRLLQQVVDPLVAQSDLLAKAPQAFSVGEIYHVTVRFS